MDVVFILLVNIVVRILCKIVKEIGFDYQTTKGEMNKPEKKSCGKSYFNDGCDKCPYKVESTYYCGTYEFNKLHDQFTALRAKQLMGVKTKILEIFTGSVHSQSLTFEQEKGLSIQIDQAIHKLFEDK